MATSMYNHHRFARAVMKKFRKAPASLTIELHSNHWLFKGQQGRLEYDGPMRPFLQALREQSIPASFLNTILNSDTYVPIYDGCLLVEIHDYRTSCLTPAQELANQASGSDLYQRDPFHASKPFSSSSVNRHALNSRPAPTSAMGMSGLPCSSSTIHRTGPQTNGLAALNAGLQESSEDDSCTKYRVVMKPDSVSMWEQLVHLNQVHGSEGEWDDQSVLQMESRILAAIAPPLALDTSFALSRTANLALAVTAPTLPFMSWDGRLIPRSERHQVQDQSINAKQLSREPQVAGESSTRRIGTTDKRGESSRSGKKGRGDAAKLGYEQQEIDIFAKIGAPSVEDLSDKARATREEKASSPMSVWNWLSRTYGYHKLRRPGQEPPSNTIFTGQNTRGGPVNGDAAAAMMAIANERANVQAEEAATAAAGRKKTTKKSKKKDNAAEDSGRAGSVMDTKPEDSKDAAPDSSRTKSKPKKKKDAPSASFATVAPKSKKRAADEMSETGSINTAAPPPPSPSQPGRSTIGVDSKKSLLLPPQAVPAKKMTKKQQRAFDAAERERVRQEAAAAAAAASEQQPPKKKAKKNANAPSMATSASLATPSVRPIGLADVATNGMMSDQFGNYAEPPVDLTGEDYNQMVPPNLLDPALPPDLANMPIGEVPENIFLAAAADVDFNFPFASGGADGGMDASGLDFGGMVGQGQDDVGMALAMLQQGQMPDMSSRHPEQSRGPPGS